jgi:hypothetical protein
LVFEMKTDIFGFEEEEEDCEDCDCEDCEDEE